MKNIINGWVSIEEADFCINDMSRGELRCLLKIKLFLKTHFYWDLWACTLTCHIQVLKIRWEVPCLCLFHTKINIEISHWSCIGLDLECTGYSKDI